MRNKLLFLVFLLSLVISHRSNAQTMMPIPPHVSIYSAAVRGYWFTAPTNFTIIGLRIPPEAGSGTQNIQVVKINDVPPVAWPTLSINFVNLAYLQNGANGVILPVSINVSAGDIIGILGSAGANVSYSASATPFATTINGQPVMLNRFLHQSTITAAPAINYSTEGSGFPIGRIEMYYQTKPTAPTILGAGSFCAGANVALQAVVAPSYTNKTYSFLWTLPDGSNRTDSILYFPNAQPGATGPSGTYKVVMLVDTGAGPLDTSVVATAQLFIQQIPPPPAVASLITFCQGSQADSIPIYGQNLQWYSVPTGGSATTTPPVINTSQPGSFTYYVAQSLNGCESSRVPVTVQVVPPAPPPTVVSPVDYCQNETATPLIAVGQNLLWYSTSSGGVGTSNVPTPNTGAQGTTYWYVTQTINGCESVRVPIEVRINYRPNALVLASRPYVCAGDTLLISYYGNADGDTSVDFNWNFPAGSTIVSGSGQGPYVVRFDSSGHPSIKLIVDNHGCVSPQANYIVEVRPLPRFAIDMQEQACLNDVVHLSINQYTPAIDSFVWDLDGGIKSYASETGGPYGVQWTTSGPKTVTVVATDNACKSAPVQDIITIRDLPDASIHIVQGGKKVCAGDSVLLETSYRWDYTYHWLPEQYFTEQNSYRQWARIDYGRLITLQITDGYNCSATDSIQINPENCCEVYFPSAFTPNGDGKNDIFRPVTQGHQSISLFVVKNRWGQQVYEGLNDRWGWDGTFAGVAQDMGVYFYYIKYKCTDGKYYEEKGEVMLVR